MYMHYWFVESERDPTNDPVVVWYNGGPGASSLFGLLVELGPLLLNEDSYDAQFNISGIPSLLRNDYSWTKVANVLVTDNPPPVGFSFCDPIGPSGDGTSCGPWNDSLVATVNHQFLVNWFKEFPEFSKNDFYLTGESYAGIYVPIIARSIVQDPQGINLKGFAVGDGCIGTEVLCGPNDGPWWSIEFFHGHGQVSEQLYNTILSSCPESDLKNNTLSDQCNNLVDQMNTALGGYYDYNLYEDCPTDAYQLGKPRTRWGLHAPLRKRSTKSGSLGGAENDYPCAGDAYNIWVNRSDVRAALNVPLNSYFFDGDNGVGFTYIQTEPNLLPFYQYCIQNTSLRVLIYNGDTDPSLNSFVTQEKYFTYLASVGIKQTQAWRPWTLDGQRMGGYVTEFQGDFDYLTIRGSGHMVPEYKPPMALEFLTRWLANEDYLPYSP